jgi:hypothetical protein
MNRESKRIELGNLTEVRGMENDKAIICLHAQPPDILSFRKKGN